MRPPGGNCMNKVSLIVLCVMLATAISMSGLYLNLEDDQAPVKSVVQAADPPHNITHFLHTGDTTKYFSPQFSVLNYFDTNLPLNTTGVGRSYTGQEQFAMQWYMFPPVASNLTVSGIDATIWISGEVGTGQPNMAGSLEVFEVTKQDIESLNFDGTSVCLWNMPSNTPLYTYPPSAPMVFPLAFNHVFNESATIRFVLTINPGTSGGGAGSQYTNVTVYWESYHLFDSRLVMKTQNPMTIDSCETSDYTGEMKRGFIDEGNTTMHFSANVSDPFGGYDIRWVNLTARASNGTPLPGLDDAPMARVLGDDFSALSVYELMWNYTGLPTGTYTYDIWAVDCSGLTYYYYFEQLTFQPYDELILSYFSIGITYNLAVHLNDTLQNDLQGATVWYEGVTAQSNETGWASIIVFGNGTLTVGWHGLQVYSSAVNLTEDTILYVTCDVYYPELRVVDSMSQPLPNAAVFFVYPDGEQLPVQMSDSNGSIGAINQVPAGDSIVSVWWRGSLVFDGTVAIVSNSVHEVVCSVFYMTVQIVDKAGTPIPMSTVAWLNSETHILIDSKFADQEGVAVARLPAESYDVEVFWHGNLIGTASDVVLSTNIDLTITGQVCSVNIVALDTRGIALPDAHIVVRSANDVVVSRLTNESGAIQVILPIGTLWIETYWYGTLVNETSVTLDDDANIVVRCKVSYLKVVAEDSDGKALDGVDILITDVQGKTIGYGSTVDGSIEFRLPDQIINVDGYYVREYMMTHISLHESAKANVTCDAEVILTFEGYPPAIYSTVLFSFVLLGAIAGALAVLTAFLLLRARKNKTMKTKKGDDPPASPMPEDKDFPPPSD